MVNGTTIRIDISGGFSKKIFQNGTQGKNATDSTFSQRVIYFKGSALRFWQRRHNQYKHLNFDRGLLSFVSIGRNTRLGEGVTIHRSILENQSTRVKNKVFLMGNSHVAHDCLVGNNTVFVNNAVIGGHVEIDDYVYLGGQSAVHQFCRVGKHAIIGAGTTIDGDVIPYSSAIGSRGHLSGLNLVGLRRRSFSKDDIKKLRNVYRLLFAPEGTFNERLSEVRENFQKDNLIREILDFLEDNSNRPLIHPKMDKF